jgi:NAD(P)-dependent dehydrogenase (short-subunit alcohol dehydrogenase family)
MEELDGKVCVVTGGAGGIGLALARRFRGAGMRVVLGDVERAALDRATETLGEGVAGVTCDVTVPDSVDALRDAALDRFGGVHVVCLNAGVAPIATLLDTSLETWRWAIDVNVMGVVHGIRTFGPHLVAQGEGHVVCTASAAGLASTYAMGTYSATKHAVVAIAETLRAELQPAGVGVSVLCPGPLRTRIFDSGRNRPTDLGGADEAPEQVTALYRGAVDASPDPAVAAEAVHGAVVADRLFVLPSPEVNPMVEQRLDAVRAALP